LLPRIVQKQQLPTSTAPVLPGSGRAIVPERLPARDAGTDSFLKLRLIAIK
jgi:hypothetical protein